MYNDKKNINEQTNIQDDKKKTKRLLVRATLLLIYTTYVLKIKQNNTI